MAKKSKGLSIEELTRQEISALDSDTKMHKLEKENVKNQKIIDEYKEREKASARALVLYERKIRFIKETVIDNILKCCKEIDSLAKVDNFSIVADKLAEIETSLYDVCNKTESSAAITQRDRDFISNKKTIEKIPTDATERFKKLKQEFAEKIGSSVNRRPGRPKKSEQSIVADIGLGKKLDKKVSQTQEVEEKINKIFYKAPESKRVASSIPQTDDSVFDFDEALNPNISLKDIMADLMTDKDDNITVYGNKE